MSIHHFKKWTKKINTLHVSHCLTHTYTRMHAHTHSDVHRKWWCFSSFCRWNASIFHLNVTICVKLWWMCVLCKTKQSLITNKIEVSTTFISVYRDKWSALHTTAVGLCSIINFILANWLQVVRLLLYFKIIHYASGDENTQLHHLI